MHIRHSGSQPLPQFSMYGFDDRYCNEFEYHLEGGQSKRWCATFPSGHGQMCYFIFMEKLFVHCRLCGFICSNIIYVSISSPLASQLFSHCQRLVQQINNQSNRGPAHEQKLSSNIVASLARTMQEMSTNFRKSQNAYLRSELCLIRIVHFLLWYDHSS